MKEIKNKLEKLLEFLILKGSKYGENQRYEMVTVKRKNGTTFQRRQLVGSKKNEKNAGTGNSTGKDRIIARPDLLSQLKTEKPVKPASKKKAGTKKKSQDATVRVTQKIKDLVTKRVNETQHLWGKRAEYEELYGNKGHVPHTHRGGDGLTDVVALKNLTQKQAEKIVKEAGGSVIKDRNGMNHYRMPTKKNDNPPDKPITTGLDLANHLYEQLVEMNSKGSKKGSKSTNTEKPLTQKQSEQVLKDIQAHQSYYNSTPFEFNGHVPHSKRYVGNHSPEQVEKAVKDAGGSVKKIDGVNHYRLKGKDNIMPYHSQEHTGSVIASLTEEEKKKFPKELLDLEAKRYSTSSTFKIQGEPKRKKNERFPKPEWVHEVRDFKRVSGKDGLDSYDWSQMHPNSKSVGGVSKEWMESLAKQGKYHDDHFTALDRIAEEHDKRVGFSGEKKKQFNDILSKVLKERTQSKKK